MPLPTTRQLYSQARQNLSQAQDQKKILLIYIGISMGLSVLALLLDFFMDLGVSRTGGGLRALGNVALFSSLQSMLPIVNSLVMMGLNLGYLAAMLRVSRGQYVSAMTLKLGLDRFWPLFRLTLLQGLIYAGLLMATVYPASMIYALTPMSSSLMEKAMALMSEGSALNPGFVMDEAVVMQLTAEMVPMFILWGALFCVFAIPLSYRFRLAEYILIDNPGYGAFAALRGSWEAMSRKCLSLFKLDLGLWPFHLALVAANLVLYTPELCQLLQISLPLSDTAAYYLSYAGYLAITAGVYYFLRNQVEVVYALAYNQFCPRKPAENSVVLGNIFRM